MGSPGVWSMSISRSGFVASSGGLYATLAYSKGLASKSHLLLFLVVKVVAGG